LKAAESKNFSVNVSMAGQAVEADRR